MPLSMNRRLENTSNGASKFWAVEVRGNEAHVSYGKIGTPGRDSVKAFDTPAEAKAFAKKMVSEKVRGGYGDLSTFSGTPPPGATPTALGAAASAPTPGGVMQVRLSNATPKPQTIDLKTHYRTVSYQLVRAVDAFAKIITEVKAYAPEKNLSRLATRMSALDPSVLPDLEAKQKDFLALIDGPARLLMADPVTGHLTREELEPIHVAIKDLAAWAAKGVNLPLFMKNSNDLNSQLQMPLKLARSGLPDLDALTAPRMTAQGFAKLSEDDRVSLIENAENHGYKKEDLGDDSAKVHALIGDAGIDAVFAHVQELAESEQEQSSDHEDDLEIGAPSLAALYVVKSGNEILGYQLETHINCQPSDIDIIGVHMVMPDGTLFGESHR